MTQSESSGGFETAAAPPPLLSRRRSAKAPDRIRQQYGQLMQSPREKLSIDMENLFGDIPAAVVGGVATRAYSPERKTQRHRRARRALPATTRRRRATCEREAGGKDGDLFFTAGLLGLYGSAWLKDGQKLDVLATDQPWADRSAVAACVRPNGTARDRAAVSRHDEDRLRARDRPRRSHPHAGPARRSRARARRRGRRDATTVIRTAPKTCASTRCSAGSSTGPPRTTARSTA